MGMDATVPKSVWSTLIRPHTRPMLLRVYLALSGTGYPISEVTVADVAKRLRTSRAKVTEAELELASMGFIRRESTADGGRRIVFPT
jgi:Mn-dependent DtxR family transcriptional regulator